MAREANASYEGQGQRQSVDIPRMKVRLDDLYERINIAGGLNNKIVFGDTGWASLQSENPDNGNMYRLQLQANGTITVYSSTDGGTTFSPQIAIFNSRLRFSQTLEAFDGKNNRTVLKVFDDGIIIIMGRRYFWKVAETCMLAPEKAPRTCILPRG